MRRFDSDPSALIFTIAMQETIKKLNTMELNKNNNKRDKIKIRREWVARLLLRGMTQREIVNALAVPPGAGGLGGGPGIDVSLATVNNDIKAMRKKWKERADQSTDEWMRDEIAKLDELERQAWISKKYELVLKIMNRRSKMLGMDAPIKKEHTGEDGEPLFPMQDVAAMVRALMVGGDEKTTDDGD